MPLLDCPLISSHPFNTYFGCILNSNMGYASLHRSFSAYRWYWCYHLVIFSKINLTAAGNKHFQIKLLSISIFEIPFRISCFLCFVSTVKYFSDRVLYLPVCAKCTNGICFYLPLSCFYLYPQQYRIDNSTVSF